MIRIRARGRHPGARKTGMNGLESAYAQILEARRLTGEIEYWKFEAIKLRLADKTFYTPDFLVQESGAGYIEFHEVKGFWHDDARVKIKVAAEQFPMFQFIAVKGKSFEREEF